LAPAVSAYLDQADRYMQEARSELMQTEPKVRQVKQQTASVCDTMLWHVAE
jgi:hypothetical protein